MYLVLDNGLPGFQRGFTSPVVLRKSTRVLIPFADRAFTFYGWPSQAIWLDTELVTLLCCCYSKYGSYNTVRKTHAGLQTNGLD